MLQIRRRRRRDPAVAVLRRHLSSESVAHRLRLVVDETGESAERCLAGIDAARAVTPREPQVGGAKCLW
jgi:hypothetical protein